MSRDRNVVKAEIYTVHFSCAFYTSTLFMLKYCAHISNFAIGMCGIL